MASGSFDGGDESDVGPGHGRCHAEILEDPLDLPQVDPQPHNLDEAAAPANDFVEPTRPESGEVACVQLGDLPAAGEVRRVFGVAQHDVGPGVDQFAIVQPRDRFQPEGSPGNRYANRMRMLGGLIRREVRHPGRRFGLAVHDEEVPAVFLSELGVRAYQFRRQTPSGLGDVPQAGQVHAVEAHTLQKIEGVGNGGERCHGFTPHQLPEARIHHGQIGKRYGRPHQEMAVHDAHAVAVGQRKRRCCPVFRAEVQVLGDGGRVGLDRPCRDAHQLRGAR